MVALSSPSSNIKCLLLVSVNEYVAFQSKFQKLIDESETAVTRVRRYMLIILIFILKNIDQIKTKRGMQIELSKSKKV